MEGFAARGRELGPMDGLSSDAPRFHRIDKKDDCPYCAGTAAVPDASGLVDAIYCISLREQPHRTVQATALFHRLGLCRSVIFFRPTRPAGRSVTWAVWDSHRQVARQALAEGYKRVLIFEDDVSLTRPWPEIMKRLQRASEEMPEDWWGLFLGHFPLQGYFVTPHLMRVRSVCAHAYIANFPMLRWLAKTEPEDPEVAVSRVVGRAMDGAYAELPSMYALFPMVARQRYMGDRRKFAYRDLLILYGMRPAEAVAALFSPLHWLIMEIARAKNLPGEIRPI